MHELHMIVDMQFGSCGKGLFAGYLAGKVQPDTIITAWAPNAGHTYTDESGNRYVQCAMPNGVVTTNRLQRVLIGPGSVINPEQMWAEIEDLKPYLWPHDVDIMIHEHAAVVTALNRKFESEYGFKIGSTMKGVGEATIQKITRNPDNMNIARKALMGTPLEGLVVSADRYSQAVHEAEVVIIEGAQGFSLSINQGFYPYVTSRECTKWQLFSDCGIPARAIRCPPLVHGVCRTFPIRVANRYDDDGKQIGWSGPGYPDQKEIRWEDLGVEPELTTVTRLPRRLFTFSEQQVRDAIEYNGIHDVFLNFVNYVKPSDALPWSVIEYKYAIVRAGAEVCWLGHGPKVTDIQEVV